MKKLKPILGISLLVQSITFLILALVNVEKKKNLAKVFGVFSAIGGASGVALLVWEYVDRKKAKEIEISEDEYFDEIFDDFDEYEIKEGDIDVAFSGEENA